MREFLFSQQLEEELGALPTTTRLAGTVGQLKPQSSIYRDSYGVARINYNLDFRPAQLGISACYFTDQRLRYSHLSELGSTAKHAMKHESEVSAPMMMPRPSNLSQKSADVLPR